MADIAAQPFTMKNVDLLVGTDNFRRHVSKVTFTPNTPSSTWKALAPDATYRAQGLADWTCELTVAQDWENPDSLANMLLTDEGEAVAVTFAPESGGQAFTSTLTLAAPAVGGEVDSTATADVSMAATKPTPVP